MSAPNYEAICNAVLDLCNNAAEFQTSGRRLMLWGAVKELPAVFVRHTDDEYEPRSAQALPPKIVMALEIWIYSDAGKDPNATPDTGLNTLINAIEAQFVPTGADLALGNKQTLGGLVNRCWIEGRIERDPGDLDKKAKAIIPLKILI